MRLEISFRSTDASDKEKKALRDRVERKIAKVTRFLREPVEVSMVLRGEKVGYTGELRVSGAGDDTFTARAEATDPVAVVDGLMHTVERSARRRHDRRIDASQKSPPMADGFSEASFALADNEDRDLETEEIRADLGRMG